MTHENETNETPDLPPEDRDLAWAIRAMKAGAMVRLPGWLEGVHWALDQKGDSFENNKGNVAPLTAFAMSVGFELYEPETPTENLTCATKAEVKDIREHLENYGHLFDQHEEMLRAVRKDLAGHKVSSEMALDARLKNLRTDLTQLVKDEFAAVSQRVTGINEARLHTEAAVLQRLANLEQNICTRVDNIPTAEEYTRKLHAERQSLSVMGSPLPASGAADFGGDPSKL